MNLAIWPYVDHVGLLTTLTRSFHRMGATVVVQPLDLLKNRMQLSGEGGAARAHRTVFHAGVSVLKSEGVPGLYKG